jgi:hypothetical protein
MGKTRNKWRLFAGNEEEPQWMWTKNLGKNIEFGFFFRGVRLSPLGTETTVWSVVPAPDDRWWWLWSSRWNANWEGKPKYSEKICPSATLSTTNPTWADPGRRDGKPFTTCKSSVYLLFCFRIWLTTVSVCQAISLLMLRLLVNWSVFVRKWAWPTLRCYRGICMNGAGRKPRKLQLEYEHSPPSSAEAKNGEL